MWETGCTSPARVSSPRASRSPGRERPVRAEKRARARGRSAPVSVYAQTPGHVDVDILIGETQIPVFLQYGRDAGDPVLIQPVRIDAGEAALGGNGQGLDLHQKHPASLVQGGRGRTRRRGTFPVDQKKPGCVPHLFQTFPAHAKKAQFVGGAEPVLLGPEHAQIAAGLFEVENRIHQVLNRLGTGDGSLLGDMGHQKENRPQGLGPPESVRSSRA